MPCGTPGWRPAARRPELPSRRSVPRRSSRSKSWSPRAGEREGNEMNVLVLGAGIVGVTTAYELHRDGHEVTVIDREAEPASFTSYANAGLFAPGHSYAWSSPAAPRVLLKSLWRNDQALRLRPRLDRHFLRWMGRFLSECTAERAALNTSRKARLCNYSLEVFHETVKATQIKYDGRQGGLLYLYRSEKTLNGAAIK